MTTVTELTGSMQTLLVEAAEQAGRSSGFVRRRSKLGGGEFAQALVFGWLANPDSTLEQLSQTAAAVGVRVSPQGLDARFGPASAECMRLVLAAAVQRAVAAEPIHLGLLSRFDAVVLVDGSVVGLPGELAEAFPGCGTASGTSASLKIGVSFDLLTGRLGVLDLLPGKEHDRSLPLQRADVQPGALRLADLGFFDLKVLQALDNQKAYWLTQMQVQTAIYDPEGKRLDLPTLLKHKCKRRLETRVLVGADSRISCRLLAMRVPKHVAKVRRERLHSEARRRKQTASQARLALCAWTVLISNVEQELLSLEEAMVLARLRWQIELLFKLWKSHGKLDEWRSHKPWRILTEVYAKLVAMLIQHWILVVGCWQYPDRSLTKAAQAVRGWVLYLASTLRSTRALTAALIDIHRCLQTGCRINKRSARPHAYQLLLALEP